MELWDAYNEAGEKLGFDLVRGQKIPDGVYHLVCEVVVRGTDGDFLLMQRSWEKEVSPGNWEIGAGGSALKGEDALTGACRELREETGIEAAGELRELYRVVCREHHAIYQGYLLVTDWPKERIVLQEGRRSPADGCRWRHFWTFMIGVFPSAPRKEGLRPLLKESAGFETRADLLDMLHRQHLDA